jgi:superfamily II DNA or RNA helicase
MVDRAFLTALQVRKLAALPGPQLHTQFNRRLRALQIQADLVVWDEAHHVAAVTYGAIREQDPQAWHLGLTATPMRADGAGLGDAFDDLVVAATTRELQERGYLVECDALVPQSAESGRDFATTAELAYHEHARERATVVFAATVARGREIATNLALPLIHGGTKAEERDACLRAFAQGEVPGVVNVMVLTEGWDCARADCVILERNCGSVGMYLQIVGRVLRTNPADASKRALLVDLGKNVRTHGLPSEDREFSLGDDPIKRKDKATAPLCKLCGASRRPGAESCWRCKFVFPSAGPTKQVAHDELVQYAPAMRVAATQWTETKEVHLRGLERTCAERNYKRGWVAHRFKTRWGHWPWEMQRAS